MHAVDTILYYLMGRRTVIRFVSTSAKLGFCTVVGLNGTLVEDKMRTFQGEYEHLDPFRPTTVQVLK